MSNDPFAEVFSSEGFAAAYKRKLKPPTRGELQAEREAHAATRNPLAVMGLVAAPAATNEADPEAAALAQREHYKQVFESLTPEARAAASNALLDVELDELVAAPAASDEWESVYDSGWDEEDEA